MSKSRRPSNNVGIRTKILKHTAILNKIHKLIVAKPVNKTGSLPDSEEPDLACTRTAIGNQSISKVPVSFFLLSTKYPW